MQAPDPIETIMARLMPPALSQQSQAEMDAMIDDLAGPEAENVVEISSKGWLARGMIGGGIAAMIGALCAVFPLIQRSMQPQITDSSVELPASGLVFVSKSDRIESMTDAGWREDSEGSAMHAVRLKSVQESNLLDEASGMLVKISQPREEILMMPVEDAQKSIRGELVQTAMLPVENNGPLRVVNVAGKNASFSSSEGSAVVTRDGELYLVKINGPKNEAIFEGKIAKDEKLEKLPENWRRRVQVLCRTLDQALDGALMMEREPRPRVAPPVTLPSQKP
jgi:hypothetical protein